MLSRKALHRTAAAAAATVLMAVGATGPAFADREQAPKDDAPAAAHQGKRHGDQAGTRGDGKANPPRHTPVTVCHLLGNGSYNILTFDDSALKAHEGHGDLYPVPDGGCPASADDPAPRDQEHFAPGHTPVTVCHLLGNGTYNILTFDDSALKAHEGHGDLYPVPDGGCPEQAPAEQAPATPEDDTPETTLPGETTPDDTATDTGGTGTVREPVVLGVQETRTRTQGDTVAGTEETAGANRAAPVLGPLAGILPQTGAAQVGLALVAGIALLGAGATVLMRRRSHVG